MSLKSQIVVSRFLAFSVRFAKNIMGIGQLCHLLSTGTFAISTWAKEQHSWQSGEIIGNLTPFILQPGRGINLKFELARYNTR